MNIFRFPRTAEAVRSPIRVRASQGLRAGVAAAIFTFSFGFSLPAMARAPVATANAEIARCIRSAAHGKPWLERTLWGLRDQEGGWIGAAVVNSNGTHDLGPLQINSSWVPKIAALVRRSETHVRHWLQNDACFNAEAARWIFLSGLALTGDYWKAIGVYHSPTAWRQARYATSVAAHLQKRFGKTIF
ncbi:lytic transglycosylase domain-containing protein [Sphingopyxis sp. GW247-27LB]|uniref:lytic transglycosylase domain-containing protein n=1 Tax=Sphingopyxis sp. GW247-27LB TaxID=2012632 RepID=UPI0026CBBEE5